MFWRKNKKKEAIELQTAQAELLRIQIEFLPHMRYPTTIVREGSRWVCSFQCHPDPLQCVTAYGDSPSQACANFDALWNADPPEIDPEELEQF